MSIISVRSNLVRLIFSKLHVDNFYYLSVEPKLYISSKSDKNFWKISYVSFQLMKYMYKVKTDHSDNQFELFTNTYRIVEDLRRSLRCICIYFLSSASLILIPDMHSITAFKVFPPTNYVNTHYSILILFLFSESIWDVCFGTKSNM